MTEDFQFPYDVAYLKNAYSIHLTSLAEKEIPDLVVTHLSYLNRELPEHVLNTLHYKSANHSPLYISLLINRINMLVRTDYDAVLQGYMQTLTEMMLLYMHTLMI